MEPGTSLRRYTMKKTAKKMVLNRETLVRLEQSLDQVAGGFDTNEYSFCRCPDTGRDTCMTCEATCTTNFC
jgi:hypothetical protein